MKAVWSLLLVLALAVAWTVPDVSAGPLAAAELEKPKDKARNQVPTTVLSWKAVAGAKAYRVLLSMKKDGLEKLAPKAACPDCLVDQKVTEPTYQIPPKVLDKGDPYYWTVRALDDADEGPSAPIRSYNLADAFFSND